MSGWITYRGITVKCGHCGLNNDKVHTYIWYANQHGAKIRVFCGNCDRMTDCKKLNDKPAFMKLHRTSVHGQVPVLPPGPQYDKWVCLKDD